MSEACVTDSFARAKEAWSGSIRSPYPDGAQAAGRIHPLKVCVTAAAVVNPGCALLPQPRSVTGALGGGELFAAFVPGPLGNEEAFDFLERYGLAQQEALHFAATLRFNRVELRLGFDAL